MITIFGIDHSPWTQVVMLGCELHSIPYRLINYPFSLKAIWRHGLMMPTARLPNGEVLVDSLEILYQIENNYSEPGKSNSYGLTSKEKKKQLVQQARFTFLFFYYVLTRGDSRTFRFFKGWSKSSHVTDNPVQKLASVLFKPFLAQYFYFLIKLVVAKEKLKRQPLFKVDKFKEALTKWDDNLTDQSFLNGEQPGYADLTLYGHYQTMHTGLSAEVLPYLEEHPRLVEWSKRMQGLFTEYSHGYSFSNSVKVKVASKSEQVVYWTLWLLSLPCLPITLGLFGLLYGIRAVRNH